MVGETPAPKFSHVPVMLAEVVALVASIPPGIFVDATVGGGSHSEALLAAYPHLQIIGIDQDPMALSAAADRLQAYGPRVKLVRARFDGIGEVVANAGATQISGFLFDLGVSSPQLDRGERGFSFRNNGPLDMRMDPDSGLGADEIVNTWDVGDIATILRRNADERFAGRIANAIVSARPIADTAGLAEIVAQAIPAAARRTGGHPAKRTFQALRIAVNSELEILRPALSDALAGLVRTGRGLVLTYHSGEDKIVKDLYRTVSSSVTPPGLPIDPSPQPFSLVRPPARKPGSVELENNPRASSARLRVIERVGL
jgi:16S rRNA (cytosine1402-N4)-methyltransferase